MGFVCFIRFVAKKTDPAVWAKSCPHVNRTRSRTPLPAPAPWNRSSSNVFPQVFPTTTTQKLSLAFLWSTAFQNLSRWRCSFFRPRKIPNFCRQVNTLVCKLSSKEALLEVLTQVFLPKNSRFAKKKLLNFLIASTIFFSAQSVVEGRIKILFWW